MKIIKNGARIEMSYNDICKELGFIPEVNFVRITKGCTISFTAGKHQEIVSLLNACRKAGYKPSKALIDASK